MSPPEAKIHLFQLAISGEYFTVSVCSLGVLGREVGGIAGGIDLAKFCKARWVAGRILVQNCDFMLGRAGCFVV